MAETRHIAHEKSWVAVCTDFDYCWVGDEIVGFDSYAFISNKAKASPNVKAQGTPVYRVGDMHMCVRGDAGAHVEAGTSLDSGYVKFLSGQDNVKANGISVVRHGSDCLVNCDADGKGGAKGKVITVEKTPPTFLEWVGRGFISVAETVDDAFTGSFEASMNHVPGIRGTPYPEADGFGAGFWAEINGTGGEQAGLAEYTSNVLGGSSEYDFPAGTFPQAPPPDPGVTKKPGYQKGAALARLLTLGLTALTGGLTLRSAAAEAAAAKAEEEAAAAAAAAAKTETAAGNGVYVGGTGNLITPWPSQNVRPLPSFIQSGENTCGQACAASMAQSMGYTDVTEQTLIDAVGINATEASPLANAIQSATGESIVGGTTPFIPAELTNGQMQSVVNNLTGNGVQPIMTLLHAPGQSVTSVGHWVMVDGLDAAGNVMIRDPAGLQYTMTPSNFTNSWVSGALVKPSK
jgi:uncharacterized Zn-binding protein involved in type VI secretion